jgi:hypothetical protein
MGMAYFEGTIREFTKFVGPYARLKVAFLAASHKRQISKCEECGSPNQLEAAHVKGKERALLIANILSEFIEDHVVKIDLDVFEERFVLAHLPIETTIRILCKECHRNYDKTDTQIQGEVKAESSKESAVIEKMVSDQMNKSKAMQLLSARNFKPLNDSSTIYSNVIASQRGWWLQPSNDKFNKELYVVLHDEEVKRLYFFVVPANAITEPAVHFNQRNDKHRSDCSNIYISKDGSRFKERNGFDFSSFLNDTIAY